MLLRIGTVWLSFAASTLVLVIICHANYEYFLLSSWFALLTRFWLDSRQSRPFLYFSDFAFLVFADARGRSQGFRGHSRTFADVRGRSRAILDIRRHSWTFAGGADVRGLSRNRPKTHQIPHPSPFSHVITQSIHFWTILHCVVVFLASLVSCRPFREMWPQPPPDQIFPAPLMRFCIFVYWSKNSHDSPLLNAFLCCCWGL